MTKRHIIKTSILAGLAAFLPFSLASSINLDEWNRFNMGSISTPISFVKERRLDILSFMVRRCIEEKSNVFSYSLSNEKGNERILSFQEFKSIWKFSRPDTITLIPTNDKSKRPGYFLDGKKQQVKELVFYKDGKWIDEDCKLYEKV